MRLFNSWIGLWILVAIGLGGCEEEIPDVLEAAVAGVPDERWRERLRAYVVPRQSGASDAAVITAFCETDLSSFKVPRDIVFLDELPKNANGKILKRALRRQ